MASSIESVGDVRVCPACLFASQIGPAGICEDCWMRRERWQGGGPLRYVEIGGDHAHEDPRCPELDRAYRLATSEDVTYSDHDQCQTCRSYTELGELGVHLSDETEEVAHGD